MLAVTGACFPQVTFEILRSAGMLSFSLTLILGVVLAEPRGMKGCRWLPAVLFRVRHECNCSFLTVGF